MNKSVKYILLAVGFVALLLIATKGYDYLSENYSPETTQQTTQSNSESTTEDRKELAPDFTVYNKSGDKVTLTDMQGTPTIVNFWATWCGPCNYEMPDFQSAYEKYGDKVNFMMINLTDGRDDTVESVNQFIKDNEYSFPVYYDLDLDAANTYGAYSIPRTYIIDAEGYIVFSAVGPVSEETLISYIENFA